MSKPTDPNKILMNLKFMLGLSPTEKFLSKEETYRLYGLVHEQVEQGYKDNGVWAAAFSQSQGDLQKTKALYIELMVERIKDAIEAGKELSELFFIQAEETIQPQAEETIQPSPRKKRKPLTKAQKKKKAEERLKSLRSSLSALKKKKKAKVEEGVSKKALDIINFSITTHTKQIRSLLKELDK